jgi:hypothetical protein
VPWAVPAELQNASATPLSAACDPHTLLR